jgi:hypothetical protein
MTSQFSPVRRVSRASGTLFRTVFPPLVVFAKAVGLMTSRRSFLRQSGYIQSVKLKKPVRRDGSPIPWMNYSMVAFLEERLQPDLSLFEYGCGNSTLFYASRVASVVAVERDPDWYRYVEKNMPTNVRLILHHPFDVGEYISLMSREPRKFDVIVVDDAARAECLLAAPPSLSDRGVILIDDTQRGDNEHAIAKIRQQGFRSLVFRGLKPNAIREYCTTLLYRDGNCLGL